jgi:hypothetical protein
MMKAIQALREKIIASQNETMARIKAWGQTDTKDNEEDAMACEEKTEVRLEKKEEPTSVEIKPEVADEREVPVQDAARMPVGEPRKKRRDRRRLAAGRRQEEEDLNLDARRRRKGQGRAQRKHRCLKNLVAARSGTTCRAVVARRRTLFMETTRSRLIVAAKEVSRRATLARRRRDATKKEGDDARKAPMERTAGKRRRVNPEGNTATKDPDASRQLHLRNVKTAGRLCREDNENAIEPKLAKLTARFSARTRTTKDWTLWRGRPPPKRKK